MANLLIPDLVPNTQYAVEVRAVRTNGVSEWSARSLFTTVSDTVLPLAPVNVTWAVSGDSFAASWDTTSLNVNGEVISIVRYEVELVANSLTRILSVPQTTGSKVYFNLSYEDNRSLFGSPQPIVQIRVRAVSNIDTKSAWTAPLSASNPVPANPTSVTATAGPNQIALTWVAPSDNDVIGYNIYLGATLLTFVNATSWIFYTTGYVSTTLTVKAVDKFNQLSTGANSNAVTPTSPAGLDTTAPPAPTTVTATPGYDTSTAQAYIDASWTAVSATDLSSYLVRYSTNGANWNYITVPAGTTSVRFNVNPGTTYYVAVSARDYSANTSGFTNAGTYPVTSTADTTAPSQPAAPTVAANTLQLQVSHSGLKQAGGVMETDVSYYEVYASTTTGFTPSSTNMIGTMQNGPIILGTFDIPATGGAATQTWFVKVIAVDRANNKSTASNQSSGNVALISATNIVDATITNAKISDLSASKITAGTISAQTINIGATGVLNVDSTGIIKSNNYVANTTGYRLTNTSLEINNGTISAAALNIQIGNNIMTPKYAGFEYVASAYPTNMTSGANTTSTITTAQKFINSQSLLITNTSGSVRTWYMGDSSTDYNIKVTPNTRYLISMYIYNSTGAVVNGYFGIIQQDGQPVVASTTSFANTAGWVRYTMAVTTTATASSAIVTLTLSSNATMYIDAIQVEPALNTTVVTPSPWTAPGSTIIDGGMIRTGSIVSSSLSTIWDTATEAYIDGTTPAWSIDTSGDAVFSSVQVLGSISVGDVNDQVNSGKYVVGSAFYVPGITGWIMRGDGWVEFNQIVADSIDGSSIKAGTLSVDTITAGTLGAKIRIEGDGGIVVASGPDPEDEVIFINPTDGLIIDPPGDSYVSVPMNGDNIQFTNIALDASSATFNGNVSIYGTDNYISGELVMAGSVANPVTAPTVVTGWTDPTTFTSTTMPSGYGAYGLCLDYAGTHWMTTFFSSSGKNMYIAKLPRTGGPYTLGALLPDSAYWGARGIDSVGGIAKITLPDTTQAYAVMFHTPSYTTEKFWHSFNVTVPAAWWIGIYNASTGAEITKWEYNGGLQSASIFSDGTYLYIGGTATNPANTRWVRKYAWNGATDYGYIASSTTTSTATGPGGLYIGAADWGAGTQYLINNYNGMMVLNGLSATNDATKAFPRANFENSTGILWDGTKFRSLTAQGKVYIYSSYDGATATLPVQYAWYDSNSTGGTHKTLKSNPTNGTFNKRGWTKVTTPPIPTGSGTDTPDQVRIYINGVPQPDLGVGVRTAIYSSYLTSSAEPVPSVNEFASLPQAGILKSDAGGASPIIKLSGDGSGRVGPWQWDTTGELPAIFCHKTSAQIVNGSALVPMNVTDKATGGMALSAGGMIKVPRTGWYLVTGQGTFIGSASQAQRVIGITVSDTDATVAATFTGTLWTSANAGFNSGSTSGLVYATANQYIGLWANTGTSWTMSVANVYMNTLSAVYVGG